MRFLLRFAHDTWRAKTAIIARTPFSRIRISSTAIGRARCDLPQVVPGTCDYPQRCWNQRDYSFEAAIWAAFELQVAMRGRRPPYQLQAINGGQFRQVNRESLEIHTEQLGRLPSKRDSEAALWDSLISRPSTLRRYAVEVREDAWSFTSRTFSAKSLIETTDGFLDELEASHTESRRRVIPQATGHRREQCRSPADLATVEPPTPPAHSLNG